MREGGGLAIDLKDWGRVCKVVRGFGFVPMRLAIRGLEELSKRECGWLLQS